jgi:methyltransferase (TIGR00027 family)
MQPERYSRTALLVAFMRAQHHLHDGGSMIDDPLAHRLLTAGEMAHFSKVYAGDGAAADTPTGDTTAALMQALRTRSPEPNVLARARYTEDRLAAAVERGVRQYVLVGAGLDTFAFRRADLRDRVQVFELDHPQSQAFKRERLAAAGITDPQNLHWTPVDFEHESVADALRRLPFHSDEPAVFAWLGVTMYLTRPAIEATWGAIRSVAARGSELVFDFLHADGFANPPPMLQRMRERTRAMGEPMIGGFDPSTLAAELATAGWTLVDLLGPAEIQSRLLAGSNGYRPGPIGHIACAAVQ